MTYDWTAVEAELREWQRNASLLSDLSPLALDTLWGSVRGLRWPGMSGMDISMEEACYRNRSRVLDYTFDRLTALQQQPNFTFHPRVPERCRVGFGTFGWKYDPSIAQEAAALGMLIDTAEGYGYGRVETRLGMALQGVSAEVSTKVRRDHMSPMSLKNALLRSRKKLGRTPHYQIHYPHYQYPEIILDLARFRNEGMIKSIGVGNCSVDQVESDQRLLSDHSGDAIRSVQVPFSLLDQRVRETMIPYCQERGILVIAYSPLGQSMKVMDNPVLRSVATALDAPPATVALAWILGHPGVMPIPRTNSLEHLRQNFDAYNLVLDDVTMEELRDAYQNSMD